MTYVSNARTVFQDGESITSTDLTAISANLTRRAWDVPGYANLLGFDQMDEAAANDYNNVFTGTLSGSGYARSRGVFTRGGGLRPAVVSGLGTKLDSGVIGVWSPTALITPPTATGDSQMIWGHINGSDVWTHDTESAGYKRWDVVSCYLQEADATPVTRDFEDSVTGAKTSESVVTAKTWTLGYTVTKGTHSNGTPTIPTPTAGAPYYRILFAALVDGDAGPGVTKILDFTIPVGPMRKQFVPATRGVSHSSDSWAPYNGVMQSSNVVGNHDLYLLPPDGIAGNGEARILGVRLSHVLATGCTVQIGSVAFGDPYPSFTELDDLSGIVSPNGTTQVAAVDFRSLPHPLLTNQVGPYWGNGLQAKGQAQFGASLALKVTAAYPGANSRVFTVEWHTVG